MIADDIDKLVKNSKDGQDFAEKLEKYREDNAEKIFDFWSSDDPIAPDTRNPKAKSNKGSEEPLGQPGKFWKKKKTKKTKVKRDEL